MEGHCRMACLRSMVRQKLKAMEKTMECIGKKKWAEALRKEKEEEEKHRIRALQTMESKIKEEERIAWLCRNNQDINEFVKITFQKGTIPNVINGHDCLLRICEMIYENRSEAYWIARFKEGAQGRINEIEDMANWFLY